MKRFLHAACAAAMLLLLISPIKTLADNVGVNGATVEGPLGGNTQFDVSVVERYRYLNVQVMDGDETDRPLAGIRVKVVYQEGPLPAEPGDREKTGITDENGQVTFKLDKNSATKYTLEMGQDVEGFHLYQMTGITLPYKHTGVKEIASGAVDPNDPNPIPLPDPFSASKDEYGKLYLKPLHFPVTYEGGEHGNIEAGDVEYVRYGKSPTAENLQMDIPDEFRVDGWLVSGDPVPKKLHDINVTGPLSLTAHYVRQYLVTYTAGDYGYLDGVTSERVVAGEKPAHVPAPVPMTREFWFVKWRFDKPFSYKSIDPATVTINGDTAFEAVFDVRKHQPVIINTPTEPGTPQPSAAPPATAPAVVPGGVGGPAAGYGGGVGGQSAGQAEASAAETQPFGQETPPLASGQATPPLASGQEGTQPHGPGDNPSGPVSGQADSGAQSQRFDWLILVCCLLTLTGGLLRLRTIRCGMAGLTTQKEGEETRAISPKPIVTEVTIGLICIILWGYFYTIRSGPWDLTALAVWGAVQVTMAVLLIRGEYRLRRKK